MNKFSEIRNASLAIIMSMPLFAISQIETRKITFAAGKNSSVITSSVKGDQTIDYKVYGKEGQEMKVTMKSNINANYFNVLAPGSSEEAIFAGSIDGSNSFGGTLGVSGEYTIRVYLMRSAARNNTKANFKLTVRMTGGSASSNSTDALVPGTKYHATGKVRSSLGNEPSGSVMSDFGVIRHSSSNAEVHVTYPNSLKRVLIFKNGEWTAPGGNSVKVSKQSDVWEITVNDYEHYLIPQEVITGG